MFFLNNTHNRQTFNETNSKMGKKNQIKLKTDTTTDTTDIRGLRSYYEKLYVIQFENSKNWMNSWIQKTTKIKSRRYKKTKQAHNKQEVSGSKLKVSVKKKSTT